MSLNNRIGRKARSVYYILFISGLLSLTSWIVEILWDFSLYRQFNLPKISFLESVGIVSFVYIIYFGIRFGQASWQNDINNDKMTDEKSNTDKMSDSEKNNIKPNVNSSVTNLIKTDEQIQLTPEILKNIPEDERKELKNFVSRCCGIPITESNGHSSFHRRIEHLEG